MILKLKYTLLGLLGFTALRAQVNLVPNPSFEEISGCPYSASLFDTTVMNWFQPSIGSSDIYSTCSTILGGRNIPENTFGFQYSQHQENYSGIFLFAPSNPNYREYVAVGLTDTLKSNVNYCIKLYVSLSEQYPKNTSSIGMHFSADSIYQDNWNVLQVSPQFENWNGNFINDTISWLLIKGNYIASGGEKYIYIGNFRNDANTVIDSNSIGSGTYIYIDNVQVYECDSLIGIKEELAEPIKIYPNPAQDFVSIELPGNINQANLSIYNLTGQLISQKQISQAKQNISIQELGNGMYIFVIQNEDRVIGRQRVVVSE